MSKIGIAIAVATANPPTPPFHAAYDKPIAATVNPLKEIRMDLAAKARTISRSPRITAIAIPILLIRALIQGPEGFVAKATATTFSLLYLPFLAGFLILLAVPSTGFQRVMTFMVLVGCNDTFGYIIGVLFGKHPLVPKISPKKTWEGLVGSLIFTIIGGCLAFNYIMDMHWWIGIIVGLMIVFTATCGDLIESAMKRDMSLKDMGTLLPGHGGMLDRLDSVVLSAPAMWLALELVKHFL